MPAKLSNELATSNPVKLFTGRVTVGEPSITFTWDKGFGAYIYGLRGFDLFFADGDNHEIAQIDLALSATKNTPNTVTVTASSFIMKKDDDDQISEDAYMDIILVAAEAGSDSTYAFLSQDNSTVPPDWCDTAATLVSGWGTSSDNGNNYKISSWNFSAGSAQLNSGESPDILGTVAGVTGQRDYDSSVSEAVIAGSDTAASGSGENPTCGLFRVASGVTSHQFPYRVKHVETALVAFKNLGYENSGDEDDSVKEFYVRPLPATIDPHDNRLVKFHWEGNHLMSVAENLIQEGHEHIGEEIAGVASLQGGWVGATELSHFPSSMVYLAIVTYDMATPLPLLPNTSVPDVIAMHDDTSSSDTTLLPGPGDKRVSVSHHNYLATFTTMMNLPDGNIMALTSSFSDVVETLAEHLDNDPLPDPSNMNAVNPQIWVLDKDTGEPLCDEPLNLMGGEIMGGIYGYLDNRDVDNPVLVMAASILNVANDNPDDNGYQINLITITADADWNLSYDTDTAIPLDLDDNDFVVAISPDNDGDIWFSTAQNKMGIYRQGADSVQYYDPMSATPGALIGTVPAHQTVNNSFALATATVNNTNRQVAAVATNQTLQIFIKDPNSSEISLFWQTGYDAGTALKPGQLKYPKSATLVEHSKQQTWGTGATPTFFGPETGSEYVMITDNADGELNLLVWKTDQSANHSVDEPLSHALFTDPNVKGTENSAIGYGKSVIVSSTYGYPYPVPKLFKHMEAPFYGGLTRIDIGEDANGALISEQVWEQPIRSSAVPKLSVADGKIYTMTRKGDSNVASPKDHYAYTVIDFFTGSVDFEYELRHVDRKYHDPLVSENDLSGKALEVYQEAQTALTALYGMDNPLQMASCVAFDSQQRPVLWQGTMDGFFRVQCEVESHANMQNLASDILEDITNQ